MYGTALVLVGKLYRTVINELCRTKLCLSPIKSIWNILTCTSSQSGFTWTRQICFMESLICSCGSRPRMMATPLSRPMAASLLMQNVSMDCTICTSPLKCWLMWVRQAAQILCRAVAAAQASCGCCKAYSRQFSTGSARTQTSLPSAKKKDT